MWYILACVPNEWSDIVEGPFLSQEEAEARLTEIKDSSCLDPFYDNLIENEGSIWIGEEIK